MESIRLIIFALLVLLPALNAAPGRVIPDNKISDSFEHVADSDVDSSPSVSDEDDDLPMILPNPQKDFNLADHIKPKKGEKNVIGGKFKCDSDGCHAVDEEVFDGSL